MKKKILIFGAGAIGRGYLAPLMYENGFSDISFVDKDKSLVKNLSKKGEYIAAITKGKKYKLIKIPIKKIFHISDKIIMSNYHIAFSCVGPNNCYDLVKFFKKARTVISCENDITTVVKLRKLTLNKNIYFGIPDVITSNSPPSFLKKKIDNFLTISEEGTLILEKGNYYLPKKIRQLNTYSLNMHWRCKLFIHNAPHAITAYLGHIAKCKYIHSAMNKIKISRIVHGAINEITQAVINAKYATKKFAIFYKKKELRRFKNNLLFDSINRVARDPIRKLSKDNRIVLSLKMCLFNKNLPHNIATGAKAALLYNNIKDSESRSLISLRKKFGDSQVLEKICGIEKLDPLNNLILSKKINNLK